MATLKFATNVPQELHLKCVEGRPAESQFGGKQAMFTADEGVFYVSEAVGRIIEDQLRKLNVIVGEAIDIVKAEVDKGKGRKSIEWQVFRVGVNPGEQTDGTFVVPKEKAAADGSAAATAPAASQPPSCTGNGNRPYNAAGIPAPPVKTPLDEAVIDSVRMVQAAMRETGEQWSDQSRQDLVSTLLITMQREGWLTMPARRRTPQSQASEARHAA